MNRFNLASNNESLKIKKELEALMKGSKEEYHNASTSEREAFHADMGLHPKLVPENIVLKGKEVLEVSGSQRRGSVARTRAELPRPFDAPFSFYQNKNDILGLLEDSDEFLERGADSLFMTMKGESVFKAEKKDPRSYRLREGNSEVSQLQALILLCDFIVRCQMFACRDIVDIKLSLHELHLWCCVS